MLLDASINIAYYSPSNWVSPLNDGSRILPQNDPPSWIIRKARFQDAIFLPLEESYDALIGQVPGGFVFLEDNVGISFFKD